METKTEKHVTIDAFRYPKAKIARKGVHYSIECINMEGADLHFGSSEPKSFFHYDCFIRCFGLDEKNPQ